MTPHTHGNPSSPWQDEGMTAPQSSQVFSRWPARLRPAADSAMADTVQRGRSPWNEALPLLGLMPVPLTVWMLGPQIAHGWLWLALTLPVFLALYAVSLWLPQRRGGWVAVLMIAASLAILPLFPAGLAYFIFGAVLLRLFPDISNLAYAGWAMLANLVLLGMVVALGWPWQQFVWAPALTLIIVATVATAYSNDARDRLLLRSQAAVRAQASAAERERIGRDLHDLLGHTLSLITLKLELSRKLADSDAQRSRAEALDAETVARQALAQVRTAVSGMRATDLHGEIASAGLLLESAGVLWQAELPPPLPQALDSALALVLREAVTNISRHAHARHARLQFVVAGDVLQMRISDDGRGPGRADGNGLSGMRERIRALDGVLSVEGGRGQGTHLGISLPLASGLAGRP